MSYYDETKFEELLGKTITKCDAANGATEVVFECSDGSKYTMYHDQDCCEYVSLEEIIGDIEDIKDSPILLAEEVCNSESIPEKKEMESSESFTWTFYKLSTIKGSVTLRWYGSSNGYYSERVDFRKDK